MNTMKYKSFLHTLRLTIVTLALLTQSFIIKTSNVQAKNVADMDSIVAEYKKILTNEEKEFEENQQVEKFGLHDYTGDGIAELIVYAPVHYEDTEFKASYIYNKYGECISSIFPAVTPSSCKLYFNKKKKYILSKQECTYLMVQNGYEKEVWSYRKTDITKKGRIKNEQIAEKKDGMYKYGKPDQFFDASFITEDVYKSYVNSWSKGTKEIKVTIKNTRENRNKYCTPKELYKK